MKQIRSPGFASMGQKTILPVALLFHRRPGPERSTRPTRIGCCFVSGRTRPPRVVVRGGSSSTTITSLSGRSAIRQPPMMSTLSDFGTTPFAASRALSTFAIHSLSGLQLFAHVSAPGAS